MNADLDRLRLARTDGVGPVTYRRLQARYPDPAEAIEALPRLAAAGGRAQPPAIPSRAQVAEELGKLEAMGGRMLFLGQPGYPALLAETDGAPAVLSVLGDAALLTRRSIAIVGSRNASANAQRMAETFAEALAAEGLVVVSGLARGVDGAAHRGALATGTTIACIAGGVDVVYPREHARLQAAIAERGALVAEAPMGSEPQARSFPRRNRVIAGLSLGVVVVEAALKSGSLITARMAGEFGREVFAVPGSPLDERARGANALLREGAHLVEDAADILAALPTLPPTPRLPAAGLADAATPPHLPASGPHSSHATILALLTTAPTDVDDLTRRCHLPSPTVHAVLLELELAGRIEMLPGGRVTLL